MTVADIASSILKNGELKSEEHVTLIIDKNKIRPKRNKSQKEIQENGK